MTENGCGMPMENPKARWGQLVPCVGKTGFFLPSGKLENRKIYCSFGVQPPRSFLESISHRCCCCVTVFERSLKTGATAHESYCFDFIESSACFSAKPCRPPNAELEAHAVQLLFLCLLTSMDFVWLDRGYKGAVDTHEQERCDRSHYHIFSGIQICQPILHLNF